MTILHKAIIARCKELGYTQSVATISVGYMMEKQNRVWVVRELPALPDCYAEQLQGFAEKDVTIAELQEVNLWPK